MGLTLINGNNQKKRMIITLDETKKHLNVDYNDDDNYILSLIEVAEEITQQHIDLSLDELTEKYGKIPTPIKQAMLLLIGNFYMSRESITLTSVNQIPNSYEYLLSLYKKYNKED